MVDADDKTNTSSSTEGSNADKSKGNEAINASLSEVQEQLRAMNTAMEAQQKAFIDAINKPTKKQEEEDDNTYDPKKLLEKAEQSFDKKLRSERAKDMMIYNLAQEYPEIQTNKEVRQAVLEAQKSIPEALRDTADGYEMAVLKAVSKSGLVPKSKRQAIDDDMSMSSRGNNRPPPKAKVKVSDKTLMVAQLLGRDIEDPKVLAGLEAAANRETYTKYR